MNGLVGYGSSSEDEDEVLPPTAATTEAPSSLVGHDISTKVNGTTRDAQTRTESEATATAAAAPITEPLQGPMLGPVMPTELVATEYEDDSPEDSLPMSERDVLRYLTQPLRPMSSIPPEPSEPADPAVTAKFKRFLELKSQGIHFNEDLATKISFKNPSLFASLLERANVSSQAQYSSTLPSNVFSHNSFPDWAYKESLLKSQQAISADVEAAKRSQSAVGKRTIEFTSAGRGGGISSRESLPGNLSKRKRI